MLRFMTRYQVAIENLEKAQPPMQKQRHHITRICAAVIVPCLKRFGARPIKFVCRGAICYIRFTWENVEATLPDESRNLYLTSVSDNCYPHEAIYIIIAELDASPNMNCTDPIRVGHETLNHQLYHVQTILQIRKRCVLNASRELSAHGAWK